MCSKIPLKYYKLVSQPKTRYKNSLNNEMMKNHVFFFQRIFRALPDVLSEIPNKRKMRKIKHFYVEFIRIKKFPAVWTLYSVRNC